MQTVPEKTRRGSADRWTNLTLSDLYSISECMRKDKADAVPFTMGVEKCLLCKFSVPVVIAIALSASLEVGKGIGPPESNCESLPRYWSCPEGKEKVFQLG
jgi:hypothetical protein